MPTFTGTNTSETINGTDDADVIEGGAGNDVINGLGGDDTITDSEGSDTIDGGAGNDRITIARPYWVITGEMHISGGDGNDYVEFNVPYEIDPLHIDLGAGDDHVLLRNAPVDHTFVTLGGGVDTIQLAAGEQIGPRYVLDFTPGSGGDIVDLAAFLDATVASWDPASNPFGDGTVSLVQQSTQTVLEFGFATMYPRKAFLVFSNTTVSSFTAANFSGFDPSGATAGVNLTGTAGTDTLVGADGDDILTGLAGSDTLQGNKGTDTLHGGADDDRLEGGRGDDVLYGDAGNDTLIDGAGASTMYGGDGDDAFQLVYFSGSTPTSPLNTIYGGAGNDSLNLASSDNSILVADMGDGNDQITFELMPYTANLTLGSGTDVVALTNYQPTNPLVFTDFQTGAGGDRFVFAELASRYTQEPGSDPFAYGYASLVQDGAHTRLVDFYGNTYAIFQNTTVGSFTAANFDADPQAPMAPGITLTGTGGRDDLRGTSRPDVLDGADGDDLVGGGASDDQLSGGSGNDLIQGSAGNDIISGGDGEDTIDGGSGADVINAGAGNDTITYHDSLDTIDGGAGYDTLDFGSFGLGGDVSMALDFDLTGYATTGVFRMGGHDVTGIESLFFFLFGTVGGDTIDFDAGAPTGVSFQSLHGEDALYGTAGQNSLDGEEGNDTLLGRAGNDNLNGGFGNDTLDGGTGADAMAGGSGDDTYFVDNAGDTVSDAAGQGHDRLFATLSWTLSPDQEIEELAAHSAAGTDALNFGGNEFANTITGNAGANTLTGAGGDDVLEGLQGNDILDGGAGNDRLNGSDGDDTAYVTGGTTSANTATEIVDLGYSVPQGSEYGADHLIVDYSAITEDVRFHNSHQDDLGPSFGPSGAEAVADIGGATRLTFYGVGRLTVATGSGNDLVYGVSAVDVLSTGAGNDTIYAFYPGPFDGSISRIDGGAGFDVANSVKWSDLTEAVVFDLNDPNGVTIGSGANERYLRGIESFWGLTTGSGDDVITLRTDGALQNLISTGDGSDTVNVYGGATNETTGITIIDMGYGAQADHLISDFSAATESVHYLASKAIGNADVSIDGVQLHSYSSIERVTLTTGSASDVADGRNATFETLHDFSTGAGADSLYGGYGNDRLDGGADNDLLDGGFGDDTLIGGTGDDSYIVVDNFSDVVIEGADEGSNDHVFAKRSYVLGAGVYVETLSTISDTGTAAIDLTGNAFVQVIVGNAGANVLLGLGGDDALRGGGGADRMEGGTGNDTYEVDDAGDQIVELTDEGIDGVTASASYELGANLENLTLAGAANLNGGGNALANLLTGNAGSNWLAGVQGDDVLDGGLGRDRMDGGGGNDTYHVDNAFDWVVENAGEGTDQVLTSISYQLIEHVENLTLAGNSDIAGGGNALANLLTGNAGNNWLASLQGNDVLDGGLGADRMDGGTGDDTYHVDNAGDWVIENAGEGTDQVLAATGYQLADNVENLTLVGSDNTGGGGNALANVLTGNAGNNWLAGLQGNDMLDGGLGADRLDGGADHDTFAFTSVLGGGNVDWISDFAAADDTIHLDDAVFTGLAMGALASGAFATGAAATEADDRIVYDDNTGVLLFDVDGVGGVAAVQFATLNPGLTLTSADFLVV